MSKDNLNCKYNLDKLNFSKIKKELEIIPQIIRNHNKIGLRSCISASNIYNQKKTCITNNSKKELMEIEGRNNNNIFSKKAVTLKKSKSIQVKNSEDIMGIKNTNNNNFNSRSSNNNSVLNEEDIFIQIKLENKRQIDKIKNAYEKKISELTLFYENKFTNLNKLLQNNIKDFINLSKNFISLNEHNKIINEIKKTYNDLIYKTKQNYEKIINELTDIMKNKVRYKDLIHRLQYQIEQTAIAIKHEVQPKRNMYITPD